MCGCAAPTLGMLCCKATAREVANNNETTSEEETLDSQRAVSFSRRGAVHYLNDEWGP